MRRLLFAQRNRIWMKAVFSSFIICILIYFIIRCFSFDFPLTWKEELLLFIKVVCSGMLMMVAATTATAYLYKTILRRRRNR